MPPVATEGIHTMNTTNKNLFLRRIRRFILVAFSALLSLQILPVRAAEYTLVVQPILPPSETRKAFEPLAAYLSQATGQQIKLVTALNFLTYWETMKQKKYQLILDAAHFTGYRVTHMGYTVLGKIPGEVSYTLVTGPNTMVLGASDLIGKTIATIAPPSLGAVRLTQLFPNPLRQPVIVEVNNSVDAIRDVLQGKVIAALVPSPLVQQYPNLNTVLTTDPVPHIALSAAPSVPKPVQKAIKNALLNAEKTPAGKAMLKAINFPGFVPTSAQRYAPYGKLLQGTWGY